MNQAAQRGWRQSLEVYSDRRVLLILLLGFSSGLPYLLTFSTLSAWLATVGVKRAAIGAFALVATPYSLKFLWAPLMDRLKPPLPLGLASSDPRRNLLTMAALAFAVAFLSASQDVVIDAFRVEYLPLELQGPGAGTIESGYRVGMLVSGAGALVIAAHAGWHAAYVTMAVLQAACMFVFLFSPEPALSTEAALAKETARESAGQWFKRAVVGPFADFMKRPLWPVILLFAFDYKLGEGMAAIMSTPLYINSLHFTLGEIALVSKFFGCFAVIVGALIGGMVTVRFGILRSLMICGVLQVVGNAFYVWQAVGGHRVSYLAICVTAEQVTSAMAGAALVAYLSSLCSPEFTATQYALLSSLTFLGAKGFGASSGVLADAVGWVPFFLITTAASVPALLLLVWIMRMEASKPAEGPLSVAVAKN